MPAIIFLDTPVEIAPVQNGSWQTVDVSAYVSNASGIIVRVSQSSNTLNARWDMRKNGSTDDFYTRLEMSRDSHTYRVVGIDASNLCQMRLASVVSGSWTVHLVGYLDADECVCFTNCPEYPGSAGSWQDWDISGETGGDTAIAAIVMFKRYLTSYFTGIRMNGSTDERLNSLSSNCSEVPFVGCDGNEVFEVYIQTPTIEPVLVGYIKSGVTMNVNALPVTLSGPLDSWEQIPNIGPNAGAFFEVIDSIANNEVGYRPSGNADYVNLWAGANSGSHYWGSSGSDGSNDIDLYRSGTGQQFFLIGTVDPDAAPPPAKGNPILHGVEF